METNFEDIIVEYFPGWNALNHNQKYQIEIAAKRFASDLIDRLPESAERNFLLEQLNNE